MIARASKSLPSNRALLAAGFVLALVAVAVIGLRSGRDGDHMFVGDVRVGFTTSVGPGGVYQVQNVFANNTHRIIAIVQIEHARPGMKVTGRWYRSGLMGDQAASGPEGREFDSSGLTLNSDIIDQQTGLGSGSMTLTIFDELPADAYVFRLFIDGKLAKVAPLVLRAPPG